jgi:hypothetical protein
MLKCLFHVITLVYLIPNFSSAQSNSQVTSHSSSSEGYIEIVKDKAVDELIKFRATPIPPAFEPQMEGFRVQLYFDQERSNVNAARAKFMSIQRNTSTYIDFKAPNYNLTAGDFRDQLSAEKLRASISGEFPEAIVVKTKIYLPKTEE